VLCGYLRLPYEPDSGSNHLTEFVSTTTWSATPPATNIEETRRQAVRQNDREVRETIVRVLAQRLGRSADTSWSANDFDLTGVLFEDAWFAGARFSGRHAWFDGATFTGPNTSFEDVEFDAEVVSFDGATFESDAAFAGATFRARSTSFDGATFSGKKSSLTTRGSQANSYRFGASASPARRRRSVRRCSGVCVRRSTRPLSGRTSTSTGTTHRAEPSLQSRDASRRGRGRRTLSPKSRTTISTAEAAWQH
jgi:hypothetical protein